MRKYKKASKSSNQPRVLHRALLLSCRTGRPWVSENKPNKTLGREEKLPPFVQGKND